VEDATLKTQARLSPKEKGGTGAQRQTTAATISGFNANSFSGLYVS